MESFKLTAPASLSDTADHRPYQEQGHFEGMMNHLYPLVIQSCSTQPISNTWLSQNKIKKH